MYLYLVRHGEAVPEERDSNRPLATKGWEQAEVMSRFLKAKEISVYAIWHSKKLRAAQTAKGLSSSVQSVSCMREREGLNPMDPVAPIADEVAQLGKSLMIVSHLPFLSKLVSQLVMGSEAWDIITFREATTVCLEGDFYHGWKIAWATDPEALPF